MVQAGQKTKKTLLHKANSILVEIIKKEWNNTWRTAIKDIVQSSYQSQDVCENNLLILKELSQEIFDFSKTSMIESEASQLKEYFGQEFVSVYEVCDFVAKGYLNNPDSVKSSLIKACLETLQSFLSWIPIYYILATDLIEGVLIHFLCTKKYLLTTLKCFEEVFNPPLPNEPVEIRDEARSRMFKVYQLFVMKLSIHYNPNKDLETERQLIEKSKILKDLTFFEMFCQDLGLCLTNFFKRHLEWMEQLAQEGQQAADIIDCLHSGLQYMANLTAVRETAVFKTSIKFWAYFTNYLKQDPNTAGQMINLKNNFVRQKLVNASGLATAINHLILRTPKPQEVLIYIDENGMPKSETVSNTEASSMYDTCKEIFVNYATINWLSCKSIFKHRLDRQIDESDFSFDNLNSFCWSCGCLGDVLNEEEEKTFFPPLVKLLIGFFNTKKDYETKAVIASNVIHISAQFKRFLRHKPPFLLTLVGKLCEFMSGTIDGIKEMACNSLLKIAQETKDILVTLEDRNIQNQLYIISLISNIPANITELQPLQKIQFYEAIGTIISGSNDPILKRNLIFSLMSYLEPMWAEIMNHIDDAPYLSNEETANNVCFYFKIAERVCSSVGETFMEYYDHALFNIIQVYERYNWLIINEIEKTGANALKLYIIRRYRAVKKEIILFINTFIIIIGNFKIFHDKYSTLLVNLLKNYSNEPAEIRDAEILRLFSTSFKTYGLDMKYIGKDLLPQILDAVLPMITKDFSSYPEHRTGFFQLIQTLVTDCFELFLIMPSEIIKKIIDCVIWAVKHELSSDYEVGLTTLNSILLTVNRDKNFANGFYKFYYQSILNDILFVLLDGLHNNGFSLQCKTLYILLNIFDLVNEPLFDSNDNRSATFNYIFNLMVTNFSNLSKEEHQNSLTVLFEASNSDEKTFKARLRDYIVKLNVYSKSC